MAGIHISKNEKRAKHKKIALKIGGEAGWDFRPVSKIPYRF